MTKIHNVTAAPVYPVPDLNLNYNYKQDIYTILFHFVEVCNLNCQLQCPRCGSTKFHKDGFYHSVLHRYQCQKCAKKFNDLTGTPFASLHKLVEVIQFIKFHFLEGTSVRKTGKILTTAPKTILAWRHKFAESLSQNNNEKMTGNIEIKEYIIPINKKGNRHYKGKKYSAKRKIHIENTHGEKNILIISSCDRNGHREIKPLQYGNYIHHTSLQKNLILKLQNENKIIIGHKSQILNKVQILKIRPHKIVIESSNKAGKNIWRNLLNVEKMMSVYKKW
ncbi:MAG: hypothetical protein RR034_06035, partial [Bacteroidales bacterium]